MHGAARASRGVVVGLVVIALAAAAHLLGGGSAEAVSPGFVVVALGCLAACATLSHREWTLLRLVLCLATTQVVFHVVLAAEHGAAHLSLVGSNAGMVGAAGMHVAPTSDMSDGAATTMPALSLAMLSAHASAVLLSALLLRHGELFQLRISELLAGLVRGFTFPVRHPVRPLGAPGVVADTSAFLRTQTRLTPVSRRGPPWADDLTAWSIAAAAVGITPP
jgi:hypothetical protein